MNKTKTDKPFDSTLVTIESTDLSVEIDSLFPQAAAYKLKADNSTVYGNHAFADNANKSLSINGRGDFPSFVFNKTAADTAIYVLTITEVDLDGAGGIGL